MRRRVSNPLDLPPCVYFKHGRFWLVKKGQWTDLGQARAEAMAKYGELTTPRKDGSMVEFVERIFKVHTTVPSEKTGKKLSSATIDNYRSAKKDVLAAFRAFEPSQIKPKHVAAFRMKFATLPAKANRNQLFLKIVMAYAMDEGLIDANPVVGAKRFKMLARGRYITDAEFKAIYTQAGPRLRVIMKLCYLTGQRINDVLHIRFEQLLEEGIFFRQQKTGEELTVKWTPWLEETVAEAKALLTDGKVSLIPSGYLLRGVKTHKRHRPPAYDYVRVQWTAACAKAGIAGANLHDLRAKASTDAEKQGLDPTALLGHVDEKTTKRHYLRDNPVPLVAGPSFRQKLDN